MRSRAILLLLVFFSSAIGLAKEGYEHRKDMREVLGISQDDAATPAYKHADEVAKTITYLIDRDYSQLLADIRIVATNFNLGPSRHRLFFHWGFNENPEHSTTLAKQINEATADEAVRTNIWDMIKAEQGRRNKKMMDKVKAEFGIVLREEQNALASIMYNAHILGDYESSDLVQTSGMVSMDAIIADTIRSFRRRLKGLNIELVSEFETKLKDKKRMPNTQRKAKEILALMKEHVPKIFKDNKRMSRIIYGDNK